MEKEKYPHDISLVLCSCDNYDDTWRPFCSQLLKFWPDFNMPVYLGTESKTFSFPGLDIRCPLSNGKIYRSWSERLLKLLEKIPNKYILFMLDDFWINQPVKADEVDKFLGYMEADKKIGFICLLYEKRNMSAVPVEVRRTPSAKYPELFQCHPKEPYRITTQAGLWDRKYLMKLLRRHESAWYFETRATWRSKFFRRTIYDVKESVIPYPEGGFLWAGACNRNYIDFFDEDLTRESIKKRGFIDFSEHREYPQYKKGFPYWWSIVKSAMPKL